LKAALFRATGGPEVLSYEDVPEPKAGPGEAVVKVRACGVNRIDIWLRTGRYKASLPHILGTDIAGEVASMGDGVSGVSVGDPVVVYPVLSDGKCSYCLAGKPNLCVSRGFVGTISDGGYAEYVKVPASNVLNVGKLDYKTAACLPVNFGTAWNALALRAKVGPGDSVLVWGAAGGVGYAAIQVSKLFGATVIAAIGSDGKRGFVKSMGADHIVNHRTQDLVDRVRSFTDGMGVSVVFDHVGGETWKKSIECLARDGRMVTLGLTSGPTSEVDVRRVYQDQISLLGTYAFTKETLVEVLRLAANGRLRPEMFREMALSSARKAHELLESREIQGKIILLP
jgi:NADPH:quinone reductase-like Zn-dependent oxidoreductase